MNVTEVCRKYVGKILTSECGDAYVILENSGGNYVLFRYSYHHHGYQKHLNHPIQDFSELSGLYFANKPIILLPKVGDVFIHYFGTKVKLIKIPYDDEVRYGIFNITSYELCSKIYSSVTEAAQYLNNIGYQLNDSNN